MKYYLVVFVSITFYLVSCNKGGNNPNVVHINCDSVINDVMTAFDDSASIVVPNAYSPNGDGINDVLFIKYYSIAGSKVTIFDENNNMVFVTTLPNKYWYVTDTIAYPSGSTYYYRVQAKTTTGKNIGKCGTILLVRHCIPQGVSPLSLTFTTNDPVATNICP